MQDEEETQSGGRVEINLDVLEEALGDEAVLIEDEETLSIKIPSYDNEDDELDIAFTDGDESW